MQHLPGFRSANIHLSTDGTRVVNYAQWDSAEAFRRCWRTPRRANTWRGRRTGDSFDPHLYTVESVHER